MERISYAGDKKNFDFNKFLANFIDAYNYIDEYGPQWPSRVPDKTKVTKLLHKITESNLASTKKIILSQSYYDTNFENTKSFFITQISSIKKPHK